MILRFRLAVRARVFLNSLVLGDGKKIPSLMTGILIKPLRTWVDDVDEFIPKKYRKFMGVSTLGQLVFGGVHP